MYICNMCVYIYIYIYIYVICIYLYMSYNSKSNGNSDNVIGQDPPPPALASGTRNHLYGQ